MVWAKSTPQFSGTVVEKMQRRKAELTEMRPSGQGKTRITFSAPSRGLIGYHGEFLTDTRGTGVLNRVFHGWTPHKGAIPGRRAGVLISMEDGEAVAYALRRAVRAAYQRLIALADERGQPRPARPGDQSPSHHRDEDDAGHTLGEVGHLAQHLERVDHLKG